MTSYGLSHFKEMVRVLKTKSLLYKLLLLGHRSLIKKITQTAVINIVFQRKKTDSHCKIKETLFIQELKPSLNVNISSEKLLLF